MSCWCKIFWKVLVLSLNFQKWANARFDPGANPVNKVKGALSLIFASQVSLRVHYFKMKYTSQHFWDKTMDLGGSNRHGFRGSDRLNRPSRIRPCFDAHGFDVPRVSGVGEQSAAPGPSRKYRPLMGAAVWYLWRHHLQLTMVWSFFSKTFLQGISPNSTHKLSSA